MAVLIHLLLIHLPPPDINSEEITKNHLGSKNLSPFK